MKPLIFDSSALIAYFFGEEGYVKVQQILKTASREDTRLLISPVNLGEVFYISRRRGGEEKAQRVLNMIDSLFFLTPEVDRESSIRAGKIKLDFNLGYADAFAAALVFQQKGELVTGDKEFKAVEKELTIHWI